MEAVVVGNEDRVVDVSVVVDVGDEDKVDMDRKVRLLRRSVVAVDNTWGLYRHVHVAVDEGVVKNEEVKVVRLVK